MIGASGTTYDQNGNVTGELGTPPTLSCTGNSYTNGPLNQIVSTFIDLALSFEGIPGGNPSENDTSAEAPQVVNLEPFDPAPPTLFGSGFSVMIDFVG